MASIYREGTGWSARVRMNGQEAFKGGFALQKAAKDWARDREKEFTKKKIPKGLGRDTPLAFALRDYVYECVATQKGCKAFVSRVNVYLESAGLALLHAEENPREPGKDIPLTFKITERPVSERRLPRTFDVYRTARLEKRPRTAAQRKALATMRVGDIAAHDIEALKKAMMDDQFSNSSINNELSILSPFFTHAHDVWNWSPLPNPCAAVAYRKVNNERNRVLSEGEQVALANALATCDNRYIAPFVWFAIETAMRKGELLKTARWEMVDWEERVVHLPTAKGGKRDVPLTWAAINLLKSMPNFGATGPIFPVTEDAMDSAWERACKRAGIKNLHIHDLRHTSATRHAKRLNGNIFLLQLITGHKSLSMLKRYVNPTMKDALAALDATEPALEALAPDAPAPAAPIPVEETQVPARPKTRRLVRVIRRRIAKEIPVPEAATPSDAEATLAENVVRVDFSRRSAA